MKHFKTIAEMDDDLTPKNTPISYLVKMDQDTGVITETLPPR